MLKCLGVICLAEVLGLIGHLIASIPHQIICLIHKIPSIDYEIKIRISRSSSV